MQHRHGEGGRDPHAVRQRAVVGMIIVGRMGDHQIRCCLTYQRFQRTDQRCIGHQFAVGKVEEARGRDEQSRSGSRFLVPDTSQNAWVALAALGAIGGYGKSELCALRRIGGHRTEHEYLDVVRMRAERQYLHRTLPGNGKT